MLMPPKKKSQEAIAPGVDGKVKYDSPVSLTSAFKKKLVRVAEDLDVYPGELIEEKMKQFIEQENKRVLREELDRAGG